MKQRARRIHLSRAGVRQLKAALRSVLKRNVDKQGNVMSPAGLVHGIEELLK